MRRRAHRKVSSFRMITAAWCSLKWREKLPIVAEDAQRAISSLVISKRFPSITNSHTVISELHETEKNLSKIDIFDLPSSCQLRQTSATAQEQEKGRKNHVL